MKKILIIYSLILTLSACMYFGPIDDNVMKSIKVKPSFSELAGTWEVDSFSYITIKEEYPNADKDVKLEISDSGKLKAFNLPDMVADGFGRAIEGQFDNCLGTWELDSINGTWDLCVNYVPCEIYKKGINTNYKLYKIKGELVILVFLGDPDEARLLLFKKIQ